MIEILNKEIDNYYEEIVEVVTDYGIEWNDIYLESDYTPNIDVYDEEYYTYTFLKGAYTALDELLFKLKQY